MSQETPPFELETITPYFDIRRMFEKDIKPPDGAIDAIVVPHGRSPEHIARQARLARAVGSMLIALCSHQAKSTKVAEVLEEVSRETPRYGNFRPLTWYAIDIPPGYALQQRDFDPQAAEMIPDHCRLNPDWNISIKRNIALLACKMLGFQKIFFVDDDQFIEPPAVDDICYLLFGRKLAGLECGGASDKSSIERVKDEVVDYQIADMYQPHSYGRGNRRKERALGGQISGNSLGVNLALVDDHFPDIYNEDWFFGAKSFSENLTALSRHLYHQDEHDPVDPSRAAREEFGDIAAVDGLYSYLRRVARGEKPAYSPDDEKYWLEVLDKRRREYISLLDAVAAPRNPKYRAPVNRMMNKRELEPMPVEQQAKLRAVLLAGYAIAESLDGSTFASYMHAWKRDQKQWVKLLDRSYEATSMEDVLHFFELDSYTSSRQ